jgi:hypothetical protein
MSVACCSPLATPLVWEWCQGATPTCVHRSLNIITCAVSSCFAAEYATWISLRPQVCLPAPVATDIGTTSLPKSRGSPASISVHPDGPVFMSLPSASPMPCAAHACTDGTRQDSQTVNNRFLTSAVGHILCFATSIVGRNQAACTC